MPMAQPAEPRAASPLADALARVGDRWTLLIVDALLNGPRRVPPDRGRAAQRAAALQRSDRRRPRDRAEHPHPAASPPRARGAGRGPALLGASAALRLRAHRR